MCVCLCVCCLPINASPFHLFTVSDSMFGLGNKSEIYLHSTFNLMHCISFFIMFNVHIVIGDWCIWTCAFHFIFVCKVCDCVGMINYRVETLSMQIIACIYVDFSCGIQRFEWFLCVGYVLFKNEQQSYLIPLR